MAEHSKGIKYVDIKKTIAESKYQTLKKLPGFIIYIITKIIKQDEINRILNKYSNCSGGDFLEKIIEELKLNIVVDGEENLPEDGKCIFVSNHPFGFADGLALTHIVCKKYGHLKAIANDAFALIPQLHPFITTVNVFGRSSKDYIKYLDEVYESNVPITHFPAGEVSRPYNGKIQDAPWQKSFITKAVHCQRNVVPIFFHGRNSNLFYGIFRVRRFLKIDSNIELILLPSEIFKKKGDTIRATIGKPIPFSVFDKTKTPWEWAQYVRTQLYKLEKN